MIKKVRKNSSSRTFSDRSPLKVNLARKEPIFAFVIYATKRYHSALLYVQPEKN